jgi:hypothetical protein
MPRHGTVVAYLALFLALSGTGFAATQLRHSAKSRPKTVTITQPPAYTPEYDGNAGYLTPFAPPTPDPFPGTQSTYSADNNVENNDHNSLVMELEPPGQVDGDTPGVKSVTVCLNISNNSNGGFHGTSYVAVDSIAIQQEAEPNPNGGEDSGVIGRSAPPYSSPTTVWSHNFSGQIDVDKCLTASGRPHVINGNEYLLLDVTLGLTDSGVNNNTYGTNYIDLGRVTTTYAPGN